MTDLYLNLVRNELQSTPVDPAADFAYGVKAATIIAHDYVSAAPAKEKPVLHSQESKSLNSRQDCPRRQKASREFTISECNMTHEGFS